MAGPDNSRSARQYYGGGVFSKAQALWKKNPDGKRLPVMKKGRDGQFKQKVVEVFYIRFRLADGRWKVKAAGTSEAQAREQLLKTKGLVLAGKYVDERQQARRMRAERKAEQERLAKRMTFSALVDQFLVKYQPRGGDRSTHYKNHMTALKRHLGHLYIEEITVKEVDRFVSLRRAEKRNNGSPRVSDSTLRKDLTALGTVFRWAIARGLANSNPAGADLVRRPPEPPGRNRWLREEEYRALLGYCPQWLADIVTWACYSGMDQGQILALQWSDLTIEKGANGQIVGGYLALPRSKTGKVSRFAFSEPLLEVLNRRRADRAFGGLVFHKGDGKPIDRYHLIGLLRNALKAAEVRDVTFKTFRHTAATWALRRGIPVKVVSDMLGQSAARTTEIYLHTADDQLEAAARAMSGPEQLDARQTGTQTAT